MTLTFDADTGMRVASLRWATFFPNLGKLGLWVLKLFAMYATDGQTDGRTTAKLIAPSLQSGHNNKVSHKF